MPYNFRFVGGKVFSLDVAPDATVGEVKLKIAEQFPELSIDVDILKLIHHSAILADGARLDGANVAPSEYIVVQPRSMRPRNPPPFAADLPPPIPGGKTAPERPPPRVLPTLAAAPLVADTPENNAVVQGLRDMGFTQVLAETALFRAHGNIERAADLLVRGGVEPLADPANRHRALLAGDPAALEFVLRDALQHLPPDVRDALVDDPAILLREMELDPAQFDCAGVQQRIRQAPLRDDVPDRLQQFGARAGEREQIIDRLMQVGGGLPRDIVTAVLESVQGDEARAVEALRLMQ
jgi:hypothetical protein